MHDEQERDRLRWVIDAHNIKASGLERSKYRIAARRLIGYIENRVVPHGIFAFVFNEPRELYGRGRLLRLAALEQFRNPEPSCFSISRHDQALLHAHLVHDLARAAVGRDKLQDSLVLPITLHRSGERDVFIIHCHSDVCFTQKWIVIEG